MVMMVEQRIENIAVHAFLFVREQFFATLEQDILIRLGTPPTKEAHLALSEELHRKYISDVLGGESHYHVSKALETRKVKWLRKGSIVISEEGKQRSKNGKLFLYFRGR